LSEAVIHRAAPSAVKIASSIRNTTSAFCNAKVRRHDRQPIVVRHPTPGSRPQQALAIGERRNGICVRWSEIPRLDGNGNRYRNFYEIFSIPVVNADWS
jgi:hypothetical protein